MTRRLPRIHHQHLHQCSRHGQSEFYSRYLFSVALGQWKRSGVLRGTTARDCLVDATLGQVVDLMSMVSASIFYPLRSRVYSLCRYSCLMLLFICRDTGFVLWARRSTSTIGFAMRKQSGSCPVAPFPVTATQEGTVQRRVRRSVWPVRPGTPAHR